MLKFQIEGIRSFADNIADIKINDKVKLKRNINNALSKEAIGIYTLSGKKLGYAPFIYSQHDLDLDYSIININLSKKEIIIGCKYSENNFLEIFEPLSTNNGFLSPSNDSEDQDDKHNLLLLRKKLEILGYTILDIKVLYSDDYFIDINIKAHPNINTIYYTVTKKYYDQHLIKFNEFYEHNLIQYNIFRAFFTHRLEEYIKKSYKLTDNLSDLNNDSNDNDFQFCNETNKKRIFYNHKKKLYCYSN